MPCASSPILPFQHTAARRRLHPGDSNSYYRVMVSTHSRAEAVALFDRTFHESQQCFNTQPPKGGCYTNFPSIPPPFFVSTHSHPKAAATLPCASSPSLPFQHTAARRRLPPAWYCCPAWVCGFNTQPHEGGCPLSES